MARLRSRLRTVRGGNGSAPAQACGTPRRLASDDAGAARRGALGAAPFLLRSLGSVLRSTSLPTGIADAIIIWTHIAGQSPDEAPSVMAFVPALIHSVGAHVPKAGMRAIPNLLKQHAEAIGVDIRINTRAPPHQDRQSARSRCRTRPRRHPPLRRSGLQLQRDRHARRAGRGCARFGAPAAPRGAAPVAGFMRARACERSAPRSYLRFMLGADRTVTLAVARPGAGQAAGDGDPFPMRLIAPIDHRKASELGSEGRSGCSAK